jgi:hypothetical protein
LIFAGLVLCGSALRADQIYSNFGADFGYAWGSGPLVTDGTNDYSVAVELPTLNANYLLTSIEFVAAAENPDPTNSVTMSIYADNGGAPGGSALATDTLTGQLSDFYASDQGPVLTATFPGTTELNAGSRYWVVMDGSIAESLVWEVNSTRTFGYVETNGTAGNWVNSLPTETNGVFEVDGTLASQGSGGGYSASEPRASWLLAGGLIAVAFFARRRQACL